MTCKSKNGIDALHGFDANFYRKAYPDVDMTGLDPAYHYLNYGKILGPTPAPTPVSVPLTAPMVDLSSVTNPAKLDLLFAQGAVISTEPLRHTELVSVIMPSFNNGKWIERAINSVLSQIGARVELIVVDDGSSDDSVSTAQRIASQHDNLRVISLLRNFGCYYARNIAVMASKGDYITLLDSDDIMTPTRIARQLDEVKARPNAVASQSRLRRWTRDYVKPLSELKYAENSLMWRRNIIDEIGYYDSVRFGGDTEFRMRLQAHYGTDAIARFTDEQYFLRTLEDSLTSKGGSQAYTVENGNLKLQLSPERKAYADNLSQWHRSAPKLKAEFPQFSRPFPLGAPAQAAGYTLGQRRVGAMASFPPRRDALAEAISTILPQIDTLVLYLNNYEDIPDFVQDPKIRVIRSQEAAGDLRDNGKFYDLPEDNSSYIFTFDDDLLYPTDYVARMIHNIEMLNRSSVVGLHGVVFPEKSKFTRLSQRLVSHFLHAQQGHFVDLLGTGTTAWHSSIFKPSYKHFGTTGVCDLWFAALTAQKGIPLFSVPREAHWLRLYKVFDENLFHETRDAPQNYFDIYSRVVAPAQKQGATRLSKEAEMAKLYSKDVLKAADVVLRGHYDKK